MAAYTALKGSDAADYKKVKTVVLHRYKVNEETLQQRFRRDKKKPEKSYYAWVCQVTDLFGQRQQAESERDNSNRTGVVTSVTRDGSMAEGA